MYGSDRGTHHKSADRSVAMDALSPRVKTSVVGGKWARLSDENSSARHIIQERTLSVETESLSSNDKHSDRV